MSCIVIVGFGTVKNQIYIPEIPLLYTVIIKVHHRKIALLDCYSSPPRHGQGNTSFSTLYLVASRVADP